MKRNYYSRKLRQLKNASKQLNILLANKSSNQTKVKNLAHKVNVLLKDLRAIFSATFIKKSLAGASFVLGLFFANNANAQSYSPAVQNPFGLQISDSIAELTTSSLVDLDGDGDFDLLTGGFYDDQFNYLQNTGTNVAPAFIAPVRYPFGLDTLGTIFTFPTTVDIDGDGDMDIISGSYYSSSLFFNTNTGTATSPDFSTPAVANPFNISFSTGYSSFIIIPSFADMDNDGDQDLFVGDYDGNLLYFENIGSATNPNFATSVTNPFGVSGTGNYFTFPAISDFDRDGDQDLLIGAGYEGSFSYFQNTGTASAPAFAAAVTNPFGLDQFAGGATMVSIPSKPVDIDLDGDKDLFTGFAYSYALNFYENTTGPAAGIGELKPDFITTVYPSPTNDIISITFSGNKDAVSKIEVLDISGKVVLSSSQLISELNIKHLEAGMYTVKISDKTGKATQTKIQKI